MKDGKKCVKNVPLNLKGKIKMEDEFFITFLGKKYRIKDTKKTIKEKQKINKILNYKYISKIDEKICKWEIK